MQVILSITKNTTSSARRYQNKIRQLHGKVPHVKNKRTSNDFHDYTHIDIKLIQHG